MTLGSLPVRAAFPSPRVPSLPVADSRPPRDPASRDHPYRTVTLSAPQSTGPPSPHLATANHPTSTPAQTVTAPSTRNTSSSPKRKTTPGIAASAPHQTKRTAHSLSSTGPFKLRNDRLGTLTRELVHDFESAQSWDTFVSEFRGRSYCTTWPIWLYSPYSNYT